MKKSIFFITGSGVIILLIALVVFFGNEKLINNKIRVQYPWSGALFPADCSAPTFKWAANFENKTGWELYFKSGATTIFHKVISHNEWRPEKEDWDSIKLLSAYQTITLDIYQLGASSVFKQKGRRKFIISADSVNAPIIYREIPLPFSYAENHMDEACYSLYNVASYRPPYKVLDKFNVCGNCHSSTADCKTIALDFDASTRDKGGYFIADIDTLTEFNKHNYLSWTKLQGKSTFGLFSKISWSGRYDATTIKDRVVSKKIEPRNDEEMAYSQVFFPVNGVLAIFDREKGTLKELPGANDMNYVQSNAIWTPDDKFLIFARAKALPYPDSSKLYDSFVTDEDLINDFVKGKRIMQYDLYKIPFNNGAGGLAIPIKGASNNGRSNYFPAISPNGKWLAYCQAENLMMLRPDSKMHMVSLKTGKSEKLISNFNSMNSWHAWSPNGKWMVYSSKALSMFTDLFLTHINESGEASVPILLENSHKKDRAVNYPEFLNISPDFEFTMNYNYVNIQHILDVLRKNDTLLAKQLLTKYLAQGQFSTPQEFRDLSMIYRILDNKTQANYYFKLAQNAEKNFYAPIVLDNSTTGK